MVLPLIAQGVVLNIFQDNALTPDGRNHLRKCAARTAGRYTPLSLCHAQILSFLLESWR